MMMLSVSMMSRTRVPRAQRAKNALERHRSRSIARRRRRRPPPDVRVESHGDTARSRASFLLIHARAHHFKKTKSFWARTHSFAFLDATRLAARAMGGVPEECYAAPSLARWRGPASAREDSTRARARSTVERRRSPVVKGVSGSFGGIIEVRNANANRSSRAFSSRDRSRGGVGDGGGDARGGGAMGSRVARDGEGRRRDAK